MGMIYKSVGAGDFPEKTKTLAEQLAAMPTKGLALTKRLFNESTSNGMAEQLAMERDVQLEASRTSDYKEGVRAFLEKRAPHFTGR
jgi:2-(1,2-epoxy-1,2-dihydrophenyl)acetyl-CoA isomerase